MTRVSTDSFMIWGHLLKCPGDILDMFGTFVDNYFDIFRIYVGHVWNTFLVCPGWVWGYVSDIYVST